MSKSEKIKKKSFEWCLSTTIHGPSNLFRAKHTFLKAMWLIFFITSVSSGIYSVLKTINNYLEYDVVNEIPSKFPIITFAILKNTRVKISLKEILVFCVFNSETCTENNFEIVEDKLGFVSYRFKSSEIHNKGYSHGLMVIIYLGKISSSKFLSGREGLRLMIHNESIDSGYHIGYSETGFNLSPGLANEIVVDRVYSYKLEPPYNDCIKDTKKEELFHSDIYKFIIETTNYSYNHEYCLYLCMGREVNKHFNISNNIDHYLNVFFATSKVSKKDMFAFYTGNLKVLLTEICYKECPSECDSVKYDYSISATKFSIENYSNYLMSLGSSVNTNFKNLTSNDSENLIFFNVYYDKTSYTSISEVPQWSLFDLIASIGGTFGLFIGISFLSLIEIIELLIEVLIIIFRKRQRIELN
jgi:hypothetical protein